MKTYVHVKHTPVKLFPSRRLPFGLLLFLESLLSTLIAFDLSVAFPIDSTQDVDQTPLKGLAIKSLVGGHGVGCSRECHVCNTLRLLRGSIQWYMNLKKRY